MLVFDFIKNKEYSDKKLLSQIIFYITKVDNIYITEHTLSKAEISEIDKIYQKIVLQDYPLQYIIGKEKFLANDFIIDKNVLIPRSETEYLVEKALVDIWSSDFDKKVCVYDIGTGSGIIGLSIAMWLTKKDISADIYMLDISTDALSVAKQNLSNLNHKISKNIYTYIGYSDLLAEVNWQYEHIYILANLPYVDESDYNTNINQLRREPKIALVAENQGLELYFRLLDEALTKSSQVYIYIEINDRQYDILLSKYSNSYDIDYVNTGHKNIYIAIFKFINKSKIIL